MNFWKFADENPVTVVLLAIVMASVVTDIVKLVIQ